MFTWKDALLLRWAFSSQPVRYRVQNEASSPEQFVRGTTIVRSLFQDIVLGTIAFIFLIGCAWAIFITNANIIVLVVCIPVGGLATLFWIAYGFLIVSETVLGSK